MVRNESEARQALKEGRAVRLEIENVEENRQALYLIPCNGIENESRIGILICAEGRGSYFYDGHTPLKVVNLVQNGFMPLDASRAVNALRQIFPETETLSEAPKTKGNPDSKRLENKKHEHCSKAPRPKRKPTGATDKQRKSSRKPGKLRSAPSEAGESGVRGSRTGRSGSRKARRTAQERVCHPVLYLNG